MDDKLTYAKGYADHDLNNFVGIVPARELEDCEEIDGICQIRDEGTGITHIGFVIKKWDTASLYTTEWIGSKLAQSAHEKVIAALDKEINFHIGGEELKSMRESIADAYVVEVLTRIKKNLG